MPVLWTLLGCLGGVAALALLVLASCFCLTFYSPKRKKPGPEEFPLPAGAIYLPYKEQMVGWIKEVRGMAGEPMTLRTEDGLTLRGTFYAYAPGAPIELMFPGYRGAAERDLCGGVQRCFRLGHSALIVDQRAGGLSDGHVITFGVREHRDCLAWVRFIVAHFGPDVRIQLTGISMGAATVLLAAGEPLPPQVYGVLADCGYSSAPAIIRKVIRDLKLPVAPVYGLVRTAGRLFGGFDVEAAIPADAVAKCSLPVILFHGEEDAYVPCGMSREIYDQCAGPKALITVPGAGHGLSYPKDPEAYLAALRQFWAEHAPIEQA